MALGRVIEITIRIDRNRGFIVPPRVGDDTRVIVDEGPGTIQMIGEGTIVRVEIPHSHRPG